MPAMTKMVHKTIVSKQGVMIVTTQFNKHDLRAKQFEQLQKALDEGLAAIQCATTVEQAEEAQERARVRMQELNEAFQNAFNSD